MTEPAPTLAAGPVGAADLAGPVGAADLAGSVGTVETQYLDLPDPVRLDCGRELRQVRIAYETYGALSPQRDNVILVCHALSGDAHAAGFAKTPAEESTRDGFAAEDRDGVAGKGLGWWDAAVGGGSLGGMQAFEWAILFPDQVDAVVSIASTHALQPQGVAWNAIAREAIMRDPAWQGGRYYGTGRAPEAGMGVARMVGHVTYLSAQALAEKFARRLQFADDIRYTLTEPEFAVESYLRHQADSFVKRFDANTYLYMSRALTYFDLARQYGGGSLARALDDVRARTLLIAFSSDWLYPPSASREIADALHGLGKPAEFHMIEAPYGHDCFLLEEARQTPIIRQFLKRPA
jgi:homoserine acetyltransferase